MYKKIKSITCNFLLINSNLSSSVVLLFPKALEDLKIAFCYWRKNPRQESHLGKNIQHNLLRRHIQHLKYIVLGAFLFVWICFALPFSNKDPWRKKKKLTIGKVKNNWNRNKKIKPLVQIPLK